MKNEIQSFVMRTEERMVRSEGYVFNEGHRWKWLKRILWVALTKMGALSPHMDMKAHLVRMPAPSDLFEAIWKTQDGLYATYRKPKEILIGPETLSNLLGDPRIRDCLQPIEAKGQGYFNGEAFGLPIRVIPQMEGVVVVE